MNRLIKAVILGDFNMDTQEELIEAIHAGKTIINDHGDPLVFIEGQLVATDSFGTNYQVFWLDPAEWKQVDH